MEFHENLIQLRKGANLSQEQLADKLGVTRQAVSKWESGLTKPEADKVLLLCDIFNITADQLLRGSENPEKPKSEKVDFFPLMGYIFLILIAIGGYVGACVFHIYDYLTVPMMLIPIIIFVIIAIRRSVVKIIVKKQSKH